MENNVNCKEMRFVIINLVDVDDVSATIAPEIASVFPQRERDEAAQRR